MRIGIIDLGTNSVRFDVKERDHNGNIRLLNREKLMLRLGDGVFTSGSLSGASIDRTLSCFKLFRQTADRLGVDGIIAFATSAMREAKNRHILINAVYKATGIRLRVISGSEEAKFISQGILKNERKLPSKFALVDIGGGSTEISICHRKEVLHGASFELGSIRLQQVFLKTIPPKVNPGGNSSVDRLRTHIRGTLLPMIAQQNWPQTRILLGSSGTVKAIARILKETEGKAAIHKRDLVKLNRTMAKLDKPGLLKIPGMEPRRVDMILAGSLILEEVMEALGAKKTLFTDFSLRDGIVELAFKSLKPRKNRPPVAIDHLEEIVTRFSADLAHARQVAKVALQIFDQIRLFRRGDQSWRDYLLTAAYLHDCGKSIGRLEHSRHSAYIVKNADFLPFETFGIEVVSLLCQFHSLKEPQRHDLEFAQNAANRKKIMILLGILRIADGCDKSRNAYMEITAIKQTAKTITMKFKARRTPGLELTSLEKKKLLFEKTLKKSICFLS